MSNSAPRHDSTPATLPDGGTPPGDAIGLRRFGLGALLLAAGFAVPFYHLVRFALGSELYSYIVIVPLVSAYLLWLDRHRLLPAGNRLHPLWASGLLLSGLAWLAWAWLTHRTGAKAAPVDALAYAMYAFVSLLGAAACFFVGRATLRVLGFPLAFLIFLAPLPTAAEAGLESILQHGSSWTAHRFFDLSGMPTYREGTFFQLPGFSMQVAPECSGIRSTLALFLTSLVAGQMFLRSPWKRTLLAAVVLPIALVRNGFRVFVIGELCVEVGPHMIHSWIHRQGGPVFFALSLIPFSVILWLLFRSDRRSVPSVQSPA
jgi:exosortase C (VPDSG-CTERM-specific)